MKSCPVLGLPLLLAASPVFATGGFDCRTTDRSDIMVSGTIGRAVGTPLIAAHLRVGEQRSATTDAENRIIIARSWIDARELRVDLADYQTEELVAQLRARIGARNIGTGTLVRNGRTHPVRCEVE